MEYRYCRIGAERKALVAAVSKITGVKSEYLGMPSCAYQIGGCIISKDGTLNTGDNPADVVSSLLGALEERGYVPVEMLQAEEATEAIEFAEAPAVMAVELADEVLSDRAFENIIKMVAGKAALIRMAVGEDLAVGAEALPIIHEEGKLRFPWFRMATEPGNIEAWSFFASALRDTARKQVRVTMQDKAIDAGASMKYLTRCFLLKIGMIGDEYKAARKVILAGLPGNGSYMKPKAE